MTTGPGPRWAVLAVGAVAAVTVIGPPAGLALTLTACAQFAVTARRRDPWSLAPRCSGSLSAEAAPALVRLPPPLADATTSRIRFRLERGDGIAGFNLGRARARDALAVPSPG